jgi:hypothetical protein
MLKLLERNIASVDQRLVLLAPPQASAHGFFRNVDVDPALHQAMVGEMQRVRGGIYLEDGAIARHELSGGRHQTPEDHNSWHLLMLDQQQRVTACVWYMEHSGNASVDSLRVRNCPLAARDDWRGRFRSAIQAELNLARRLGMRYAEVGGWAVAPEHRCKSEGLLLALAAYSLGRIAGGALGLTTATVRHASSTILRRIGGSHLMSDAGPVPPYHDPRYNCEMELLRFDSRRPSPKYEPLIDGLKDKLAQVPVIASTILESPFEYVAARAASASLAA